MFWKRIKLFTILGFEVHLDLSWLVIGLLVTWSLAAGLFPAFYPGLSTAAYWIMGIVGTLGLLVSIVLHELSHSLVARRFDMPMKGITLFMFGGVAEMKAEPTSAKAELLMALVGPLTSFVLGGLFYLITLVDGGPVPLFAVLEYLAFINIVLAIFNMVPAFPLDGGRVLRAALWAWKKDLVVATRWAAGVGQAFGVLLIALGVFSVFQGNLIGGIWWFLIGLFVRGAAASSYQHVVVRDALKDEPLTRFVEPGGPSAAPEMTVGELVEGVVYRHRTDLVPVVEGDRLVGCVTAERLERVPRDSWGARRVADVVEQCTDQNTISADADAADAVTQMSASGKEKLIVSDHGRFLGTISLRRLLEFLQLKTRLEPHRPR